MSVSSDLIQLFNNAFEIIEKNGVPDSILSCKDNPKSQKYLINQPIFRINNTQINITDIDNTEQLINSYKIICYEFINNLTNELASKLLLFPIIVNETNKYMAMIISHESLYEIIFYDVISPKYSFGILKQYKKFWENEVIEIKFYDATGLKYLTECPENKIPQSKKIRKTFVQQQILGGAKQVNYKQKYLKYKAKYIDLQRKFHQ